MTTDELTARLRRVLEEIALNAANNSNPRYKRASAHAQAVIRRVFEDVLETDE